MGNCLLVNRAGGGGGGGKIITFDVYSAANDTVYFYENGSPITLCTTDATGKATGVSLAIPSSGLNLTLWSTVADNPNNLAQKYAKSIAFNTNTTRVDVMPTSSTLYWYGYNNGMNSTLRMDSQGSTSTATYNTNNIELNCQPSDGLGILIQRDTGVNASNYTKLCAIVNPITASASQKDALGLTNGKMTVWSAQEFNEKLLGQTTYSTTGKQKITLDISSYSRSSVNLYSLHNAKGIGYVYAIWFE